MYRAMFFDIIYALAAKDERENALFGNSAPLAREAFLHSLAGDYFPELSKPMLFESMLAIVDTGGKSWGCFRSSR